MKNILLMMSIIVLMVSCSAVGSYNRPFINAEETTKLNFGMSQEDVLTTLGDPLYVESGGDGKVVYVYEVRTILVQSNTAAQQPNKTSANQKHDAPIHELRLTFENGGLISWGEK